MGTRTSPEAPPSPPFESDGSYTSESGNHAAIYLYVGLELEEQVRVLRQRLPAVDLTRACNRASPTP